MSARSMRAPIGPLCRERSRNITVIEFRLPCGIRARRYAWWPIAHTSPTIEFGAMPKRWRNAAIRWM